MADLSEDNAAEWEAAQWVACRMGDEPFDKERFEAWLAGDPRHKPLFDTMWQRLMGPKMDEALDAFVQQRRSRRSWAAGGFAIVAALLVGYQTWPSVELFMAQPQSYAAADGTVLAVTLADGTCLILAGGARISVRYTSHMRDVVLAHGTIFADVRHDARKPFRVEAGNARIVDLGTRFEVARKPSAVRVTVASGVVSLGTHTWFGKPMELKADQAAILTETGLRRTADASPDKIARWRSEWVEYHDAPLSQVIADLESVSPLPIRITDGNLGAQRVSGRIRLNAPLRQIGNLSVIHNFTVDRRANAILLSANRTGS